MCGIVGFVGKQQAAPILLDGLSKLEYRGYDSAGIAVRDNKQEVKVVKAKGRLKGLMEKTDNGRALKGDCGIGHTRWATHGEPSEVNAHPHVSDDGNVVGVHNGIIENYQELKAKLLKKGYSFYSSTDTEVAVKLVDYYYKKYEHTPVDAINHAMVRIRGSYALALMFEEYPEVISYEKLQDGTLKLTIEAVWKIRMLDQAITSELMIKPMEDGSFQYLSNKVISSDQNANAGWYMPRLTEEEWEENYSNN